jgi:PTS system nitrogen regulatory IIA component
LAEALQAGGVVHGLRGTDKPSVLRAMVEQLRVPEELDREFLLHVLLARELLQSTGIGEGVAIPHVRNPIVLHVPRPIVTLCFLNQPVDFGALDGKPVHALFSLICPTVRAHLALLSRLSFALHDERFMRLIAERGPADEVLAAAGRVERALGQAHEARGRMR